MSVSTVLDELRADESTEVEVLEPQGVAEDTMSVDAVQEEQIAETAPEADDAGLTLTTQGATSGTLEGGCSWSVDGSGKLTIAPGSGGSGIIDRTGYGCSVYWAWPWDKSTITSVVIKPGVSFVGEARGMFSGCTSMRSADVKNLDTSLVTNMDSMFKRCSSLTELDLSTWNTSEVHCFIDMFNGCSLLYSLDISSFDTSQSGLMDGMFRGCDELTRVKLGSDFSFAGSGTCYKAVLPGSGWTPIWRSSVDNRVYTSGEVPDNVAASYRRTTPFNDGTTVTLSKIRYTYDGKQHTPTVTVRHDGLLLVLGKTIDYTDYWVSYSRGRKNAGTYEVTVTGQGKFSGTRTVKFEIVKAANPMKVSAVKKRFDFAYNSSSMGKKLKRQNFLKVTGAKGKVTYSKKSGAWGIFIAENGAIELSKGLKPGTYPCVFRVKAAGTANYKERTRDVAVTFRVKKAKNTMKVKAANKTVQYQSLKRGEKSVRPLKVSDAKGAYTCSLQSVSTKSGRKAPKGIVMRKKDGRVTLSKKLRKDTYYFKVKVTAKGDDCYSKMSKTVTCKISVA